MITIHITVPSKLSDHLNNIVDNTIKFIEELDSETKTQNIVSHLTLNLLYYLVLIERTHD